MSTSKAATLGATIVSKGQAKPIAYAAAMPETQSVEVLSPLAAIEPQQNQEAEKPVANGMQLATKSITVKVDLATYKKLKTHGLDARNKTNQDIFTEALALYFKAYKI
jgi:hypothetical protein